MLTKRQVQAINKWLRENGMTRSNTYKVAQEVCMKVKTLNYDYRDNKAFQEVYDIVDAYFLEH